MTRRNPTRRRETDTEALERLAARLDPADLDGTLRKANLLTELARLRLRELREASAEPSPPSARLPPR